MTLKDCMTLEEVWFEEYCERLNNILNNIKTGKYVDVFDLAYCQGYAYGKGGRYEDYFNKWFFNDYKKLKNPKSEE